MGAGWKVTVTKKCIGRSDSGSKVCKDGARNIDDGYKNGSNDYKMEPKILMMVTRVLFEGVE